MVTGSENEPTEASAMQKMCALAHQGKLVNVPGWEHPFGWLLNPEATCQTVLEFLTEAEAGKQNG
jgi:hypothetical protein